MCCYYVSFKIGCRIGWAALLLLIPTHFELESRLRLLALYFDRVYSYTTIHSDGIFKSTAGVVKIGKAIFGFAGIHQYHSDHDLNKE